VSESSQSKQKAGRDETVSLSEFHRRPTSQRGSAGGAPEGEAGAAVPAVPADA
jgi:hypothetical protein